MGQINNKLDKQIVIIYVCIYRVSTVEIHVWRLSQSTSNWIKYNHNNRNEAIKRLIINIRDRMHIYLSEISRVMHQQNAQSINFNPRARTRLYKHIHRI